MPMCHPSKPHYGKGKCKPCYMRDYNAANRPHIAAKRREYYRLDPERYKANNKKALYGISRDDYRDLVVGQAGRCLICGLVPDVLYVDHDHTTGKIRGLLCNRCNAGIGFLGDDADRVKVAHRYLETAR